MNYPPYNPYLYGQQAQQLPQMAQGGYMPQQAMPQGPQQGQGGVQGLSPASRPVTSREEAMGVAADFSGALMVFPDITHNRVYIKRWNFGTGAADFVDFAPQAPEPPTQQVQGEFAPLQALQDLQGVVDDLQGEIERLKQRAQPKSPARKDKADE